MCLFSESLRVSLRFRAGGDTIRTVTLLSHFEVELVQWTNYQLTILPFTYTNYMHVSYPAFSNIGLVCITLLSLEMETVVQTQYVDLGEV